jgi:hypothetical protein
LAHGIKLKFCTMMANIMTTETALAACPAKIIHLSKLAHGITLKSGRVMASFTNIKSA